MTLCRYRVKWPRGRQTCGVPYHSIIKQCSQPRLSSCWRMQQCRRKHRPRHRHSIGRMSKHEHKLKRKFRL